MLILNDLIDGEQHHTLKHVAEPTLTSSQPGSPREPKSANATPVDEAPEVNMAEIKTSLSVSRMIMTFWTGFKLNRQN